MRAKRWMIALLSLAMLLTALPAPAEEMATPAEEPVASEPAPEANAEPAPEAYAEPAPEAYIQPEELSAAPVDAPMADEAEADLTSLIADDAPEADLSQFTEALPEEGAAPGEPILPDDAPQAVEPTPAGIEELPDGTLVYQPAEAFFTLEVDSDLTGEDLFAAYADQFFNGQRDLVMATTNAGEQLTGQNRVAYDTIKPEILKVAEGSRTSTEFGVPVLQLIGSTRFTAAELGVPLEFDANKKLTADCTTKLWNAFYAKFSMQISRISTALWYDCTYEMFWFNRYEDGRGLGTQAPKASLTYDSAAGDYVVAAMDENYMFRFNVLNEFASGTYAVDSSRIQSARTAAANAKAIVKKYANCSDYAKLYAYVVEICRLTSYNNDAAGKGTQAWNLQNQGPWHLIWVFDGDTSTKVVCEGYTQAFQYLCELSDFDSGVRCYTVDGVANENHAWNLVRMGDGKNYVVDVTWIDNNWSDVFTGDLAAAISSETNAGLFLVGGSGSVGGGYTVRYRTGSQTTYRTYSENTRAAYPEGVLTIADSKFVPTGLMKISGSTYYFDENGHYVTGNRTIDGMVYSFGSDGKLTSVVGTGWQTIDGKKYYFDENGNLHTEHTAEPIAARAATCTAEGYTEGKRCKICKTVLEEPVTIPATGHLWGNPTYTWSADNGKVTATRTCVHDANHVQIVTVNTAYSVVSQPACEQAGEGVYTAKFYNEGFTTQTKSVEIPAKGHSVVLDAGYPATCTANGLTDGSHCSVCATVFEYQQPIAATGHSVVLDAGYAATCTANGLTDGSHCSVCATVFEYQQPIAATGHTPVTDPGVAPTYTAAGVTEGSHCAVCGAVLVAQQAIPALGYPQLALSKLKSNGTITLSKGDMRQLVPAFATSLGLAVTGYASSKPAAVSVDGNGVLTCNAEGKAKLTVTTTNRKKKATITIKVIDPYKPTAIAIAQGKKINAYVGQPVQLGVALAPTTAQTTLTWSSNKPAVASVDGNGLVTPNGEGTAKITVKTHNKKKATITVTVIDPNKPLGVAIAQGGAISLKAGQTAQLNAALSPATAQSALTWKTNKPTVATVDANGLVTAHGKGKAKIIVMTYNKKKATIIVNVVP